MSHFVTIKTVFKDVDCLAMAIQEVCPTWSLDTGEDLVLYGYTGDDRSVLPEDDPAHAPLCVIRADRSQIGSAANDIGVSRSPGEGLTLHVSEHDARHNGLDKIWIGKVKQQYQLQVLKKEARRNGHHIEYASRNDGEIVGRVILGGGS